MRLHHPGEGAPSDRAKAEATSVRAVRTHRNVAPSCAYQSIRAATSAGGGVSSAATRRGGGPPERVPRFSVISITPPPKTPQNVDMRRRGWKGVYWQGLNRHGSVRERGWKAVGWWFECVDGLRVRRQVSLGHFRCETGAWLARRRWELRGGRGF